MAHVSVSDDNETFRLAEATVPQLKVKCTQILVRGIK